MRSQSSTQKLILPANKIPILGKVTKITGQKVYTLLDEVRFYDSTKAPALDFSVKSEPGKMFLANDSGSISIISSTQPLAWIASDEDLKHYLRAKNSPLNALFDQNE